MKKSLLRLRAGKHIIFYHIVNKQEVEIIRILHERMYLKIRINASIKSSLAK
jgi:toxin ParE1/3/4